MVIYRPTIADNFIHLLNSGFTIHFHIKPLSYQDRFELSKQFLKQFKYMKLTSDLIDIFIKERSVFDYIEAYTFTLSLGLN